MRILAPARAFFDDGARKIEGAQLNPHQSRKEAANSVGLQCDCGQVQITGESWHLAAELRSLVHVVRLTGNRIGDIALDTASSSPGCRRTRQRRRSRPHSPATRKMDPTNTTPRPVVDRRASAPPRDFLACDIVRRRRPGAGGIETALDDAARPQHHLAFELGRPRSTADRLDPLGRESLRPPAAAVFVEEWHFQPVKAGEQRAGFAQLGTRLAA